MNQSPNPELVKNEVKQLTFPEAIKEVISGKKITKLEWKNSNIYGFLNSDVLSIHKADGKNYQWIVNYGDLNGDDWIILK